MQKFKKTSEGNIKFIAPRIVAGVFGSAGGSIVRGTKTGTYASLWRIPRIYKNSYLKNI